MLVLFFFKLPLRVIDSRRARFHGGKLTRGGVLTIETIIETELSREGGRKGRFKQAIRVRRVT